MLKIELSLEKFIINFGFLRGILGEDDKNFRDRVRRSMIIYNNIKESSEIEYFCRNSARVSPTNQ